MQPETSIGIRPWQWVATVVIVIILIALGIYVATRDAGPTEDNLQNPGAQVQTTETNRLIVTDQFPGNIVHVNTVQLSADGFVVIHKDNNGAPGAVIGSAYFAKGIGSVRVNLTENTIDGSTYYAMLHTDAGADKKFAESTDPAVKDSRGMIVMKAFKARADMVEDKG